MKYSLRFVLALTLSALAIPLTALSASGATTKPSCVVSLSPTATETLFAIGAGSQVQAVDKDSNFPKKGLPSTRIDALNPSVESIIGVCKSTPTHPSKKPDVVIISYNANSIQQKLSAVGIKVINDSAPATLGGAYAQINQLGRLSGHAASARHLVANLKKTIAKDIASVPAHPNQNVSTYYELDPTFYSLTSSTFVGSLLKSLGATNIADAQATSADGGYPQLTSEYIVSASPTLIFLADTICCAASAASVAQRPGFSTISAVAHGHVIGLSDDVASRWGPRLGLLMNQLTSAVKAVLADTKVWNG